MLDFKNTNNSWIHKENEFQNPNITLTKEVFHYLKIGESIWIDSDLTISKHQILKDRETKPSIFFRTGGTSGVKKWVEHNACSIKPVIESLLDRIQENSLSSWCCLPLNHVGGMMQVFRAIYSGGKILFSDYRNLFKIQEDSLIKKMWISLVPTQLYNLLDNKVACLNLQKFRGIFVGGASLSEDLASRCRLQNIPLYPTYGMSETAGMLTILSTSAFHNGVGGVGLPLSNAAIKQNPKSNEIMVKSSSMCLNLEPTSYCNQNWLQTPDYGRQGSDGYWFIDGRTDRFIKTGGEMVNPQEIEKLISQYDGVSQCFVCGIDDEKWGQKIVAWVTPKQINLDKIEIYLKGKLKPFMIPKVWKNVEELPLNKMGKPRI